MATVADIMRLKELQRMKAKTSFPVFLDYIVPTYDRQWYHTYIARQCQRLIIGEIDRLMVFLPPQHGKSEVVSRNLPAWALGINPDLKIVGCSYSSDLALQFARCIQRTIDSDAYKDLFPATYLAGAGAHAEARGFIRNADIFETVGHRGFYKAVGVGSSLTGTPADIGIIDDPVKDALEANSETYRNRIWDWYTDVFLTRLHNDSKQILIQTRWHTDDLAGRLLERERDRWEIISIPALCEEERDGGISMRHIGEALWEAKHSRQRLQEAQQRSPRTFNALYQQRPTIDGGNIVKRDWFQHIGYQEFKALHGFQPINFYLDTAYDKKSQQKSVDNDPSGIIAATKVGRDIYIVHGTKFYKEMPDMLRFLPEYMAQWGNETSRLCIEPKASGKSVAQMLRDQTDLNVMFTETPTDSKEVRLRAVSPKVECGRVFLVDGAWVEDFLDEVCGFPSQPHDEYVDILGYAINDLSRDDGDNLTDAELEDILYT